MVHPSIRLPVPVVSPAWRRRHRSRRFLRTAILLVTLALADPPIEASGTSGEGAREVAKFGLMPKPVLLPDGTLAALFLEHRGPGLPPTPERQRVAARYSKDDGVTWTEMVTLFDLPPGEGAFGFFVPLVDHAGEIHLFMLCDAKTGVLRANIPMNGAPPVEPLARQRLDIWHVRSEKQRTSWLPPQLIRKGRAGDLQSATILKSGRIILPFSYLNHRSWRNRGEGPAAFTYMGQFSNSVLFSDDGGRTWQQSKSVLDVETSALSLNGAVEPVVIQLVDGRLWMMLRTQLGQFYQSFSSDAGATWSLPEPSEFKSSDSPAGLLRLKDGRLVMLWNNCLRYPYAQGGRRALHGAVSRDDGRTWVGYREVLRDATRDEPPPVSGDSGVAYPFPAETSTGSVVFTLWVQTGEGRGVYSFDPDWLEETRQRDDFARGLEGWSAFGTRGVSVESDPLAGDQRALRLQRVSREWQTGAVWNFPFGRSGTLRMRIRAESEAGEYLFLLTDHFSSPFELQDQFNAAYALRIETKDLPADRWGELVLRWDAGSGTGAASLDGQVIASLRVHGRDRGAGYLRIRSLSPEPVQGALVIDEVAVEVVP